MTDHRRAIILLMALACVITVIGVIHCHVNHPYVTDWYSYRTSYSIIFPILFTLTSFILAEQLLITDGTSAPLNRLRFVYAIVAAIALLFFGISASMVANRLSGSYAHQSQYHNTIVAAVIAFIGCVIYVAEAFFRNRKSGII